MDISTIKREFAPRLCMAPCRIEIILKRIYSFRTGKNVRMKKIYLLFLWPDFLSKNSFPFRPFDKRISTEYLSWTRLRLPRLIKWKFLENSRERIFLKGKKEKKKRIIKAYSTYLKFHLGCGSSRDTVGTRNSPSLLRVSVGTRGLKHSH